MYVFLPVMCITVYWVKLSEVINYVPRTFFLLIKIWLIVRATS